MRATINWINWYTATKLGDVTTAEHEGDHYRRQRRAPGGLIRSTSVAPDPVGLTMRPGKQGE